MQHISATLKQMFPTQTNLTLLKIIFHNNKLPTFTDSEGYRNESVMEMNGIKGKWAQFEFLITIFLLHTITKFSSVDHSSESLKFFFQRNLAHNYAF